MNKMGRYSGSKTQRLYRCCSNYALIVDNGLRIYGESRTQISLISAAIRSPLARIRRDRVYADINIAKNTKSNHVMVSFTEHYSAISIDILPSKAKIEKDS